MKINIPDYNDGDESRCDRSIIEISSDDTYSLDHTLAIVIAASLKKYKEHIKGVWCFSDLKNCDFEINKIKMNDILDKMIYTFDAISNDCCDNDSKIEEGLQLFIEYYRHLWW